MNPDKLVSAFRDLGPQDLNVFAQFLADHLYDARLRDGRLVKDGGDAITTKEWLLEVADAATIRDFPDDTKAPTQRVLGQRPFVMLDQHKCPDCDHEHGGRDHCGYYLGEGNICRCPTKVRA